MEDLRIDGLGSLIGRVGKGSKNLVFDAHIDTVAAGDESQWKSPILRKNSRRSRAWEGRHGPAGRSRGDDQRGPDSQGFIIPR
jgi:hypothetical protein